MTEQIRNRIKGHRRVRAGDLVPHEWNWRMHPERQVDTLRALYAEVGYARSVLAYELPDGRLKLIDGHLRRELDPDMLVDVEVLDVDEKEARKLLLSLDSVAALAEADGANVTQLLRHTETESAALRELWSNLAESSARAREVLDKSEQVKEQYWIMVECADEAEQTELLGRFLEEGLSCRALLA